MKYTSRGLRRRRDTDKWEVILSHKDPMTGESVTTYHTIEAKTEKQALKYAVGAEVLARNPCDYCKPPKRAKTPINALDQEERTRMLRLAREAQPQMLGYIIEVALTTGLRRGEVCALRASDLLEERALVVRRSLGNGQGADIRTVADWLGHEKPSVTLDIYADVAPEAKRDSLKKMKACFDLDMDGIFGEPEADPHALPASGVRGLTFTVEQLELMLAEARKREKGVAPS